MSARLANAACDSLRFVLARSIAFPIFMSYSITKRSLGVSFSSLHPIVNVGHNADHNGDYLKHTHPQFLNCFRVRTAILDLL